MVKLTGGKGNHHGAIPGELIGIPEPTPFIAALMAYTGRMDRIENRIRKEKAHEESGPSDSLARKIKGMSLFPNVFRSKTHHRTFPKVSTDDNDGENYYRKRTAAERRNN